MFKPQASPQASDRSPQNENDILLLTPYFEKKVRALEGEVLPGDEPDKCTGTPLLTSDQNEDCQTCKTVIKSESPPPLPYTAPFLPQYAIRKERLQTPIRELSQSEQRSDE